MAEQQRTSSTTPSTSSTSTTPPTTSSSSETKPTSRSSGKKYKLAAGLTTASGIATEGQIVDEEELGPDFKLQSEEDQIAKYGRVMIAEAKEGETAAAGEEPKQEITDPGDLSDLSDEELLKTAQAMGLHFPAGTDRKVIEAACAKYMTDQEKDQAAAAKENS